MKAKLKLLIFIAGIMNFLSIFSAYGQSHDKAIRVALNDYLNGSSYNQAAQIKRAFHPKAHLLLAKADVPFWQVPVDEYASWFTKAQAGKFNGRIGEVLAIDYVGDIATAKAEILIPKKGLRYVDLFLLKNIDNKWQIISKTATSETSNHHGKRILFILSNAHFHGNLSKPAGASFSEIVNAFDTFKAAGYTVDFVSPEGGAVPLAYINTSEPLHKKYIYDQDFMYALANTHKPEDIEPAKYRAVHYVGGSSAMYGVADNKQIQQISMEIYEQHKGIISSVCHGTAGIAHLKTKNGQYLVAGKRISGYPDEYENKEAAYFKQFPFWIQKTIEDRGGDFRFSARNKVHVEVDGRVITGQNYLSSAAVAEKIIKQLKAG